MSLKFFLLGLDGFDPDLLELWRSDLPTLNAIIRQGVYGRLQSTIPPVTGPAWTAMTTGMNPGKTNIRDFADFVGERGIINSNSVAVKRLWHILNNNKLSVGLINVPVTYPPEPLEGFMITGLLTPSEEVEYTYPPNLKSVIGDYRIFVHHGAYSDEELFLRDVYKATQHRLEVTRELLRTWDIDFLMLVLSGTDTIQHYFYRHPHCPEYQHYMGIIHDYFCFVDRELGKFFNGLNEQPNIFVVSDHGFGYTPERYVYLNEYLSQCGFLQFRRGTYMKSWLWRLVNRFSTTSVGLHVRMVIPKTMRNNIWTKFALEGNDLVWSKTTAVAVYWSVNVVFIKLNVVGREPWGIVSASDYEKVREDITEALLNLRDNATGSRVIEHVYFKEDLYSGKFLEDIPDVIAIVNQKYQVDLRPGLNKEIFAPIPNYWDMGAQHRHEGIFIAYGPDIARGKQIGKINILDIAPTVYYLLGVPIPTDVDGRVLTEIIAPDSPLNSHTPTYRDYGDRGVNSTGWEMEEMAIIEQRLKDLGYL